MAMNAQTALGRALGAWLLLWLGLFTLVSCSAPTVDREAVIAAVERLEDRRVDVDAEPISSELMELADHYGSPGSGEEPRHLAMLLNVGEDALAARVHLIRAARETVDIQVYIWAYDNAGHLIYREAVRAARRGVRVRLLIDQLANSRVDDSAVIAMDHQNIEIRLFNPVKETTSGKMGDVMLEAVGSFDQLNERMHNKVMVVDGKAAIVGGRNISDDYFDLDPEFCYLDRDLLVAGPVVEEAQRSFDDYWNAPRVVPLTERAMVGNGILQLTETDVTARMEQLESSEYVVHDWIFDRAGGRALTEVLPHSRKHEVGEIEFYADPPKKVRRRYGAVQEFAEGDPKTLDIEIERSVLFQSNYLVLDQGAQSVVYELLDQEPKPEVIFLTNSLASTGNMLTYAASRKQRLLLLLDGLDVREMCPWPADIEHFLPRIDELVAERGEGPEDRTGPEIAIHAKSLVVDERIALVGSHNFDPRSAQYNTEAFFVVHDEALTAELTGELRLLMGPGNSWISQPNPRLPVWTEVNAIVGTFSRALPIFDLWPWYGYQCYELREGAAFVPPGHPDFHDHYVGMGQFPEVQPKSKTTKTWWITAFIAPIRTLL